MASVPIENKAVAQTLLKSVETTPGAVNTPITGRAARGRGTTQRRPQEVLAMMNALFLAVLGAVLLGAFVWARRGSRRGDSSSSFFYGNSDTTSNHHHHHNGGLGGGHHHHHSGGSFGHHGGGDFSGGGHHG
jgi:hypothetical protein